MLRIKKSQQNTEQESSKKNLKLLALKKKGLVLVASLALLVAVLIAGTVAWYTRVSNVTALNMNVAKFDFNANYAYKDFDVNVDEFKNITEGMAAPGSRGVVPLKIMATASDVDVTYSIGLNFTEMDDRFKERIRFYWFSKDASGNPKMHVIDPATSVQTDNYIKGIIAAGNNPSTPAEKKYNYEFIYWEWIYDLSEETDWFNYRGYWYNKNDSVTQYDGDTGRGFSGKKTGKDVFDNIAYPDGTRQEKIDQFDEFDTDLGTGKFDEMFTAILNGTQESEPRKAKHKDPDDTTSEITQYAYQSVMYTKFYLSGGEAHPVKEEEIEAGYQEYNVGAGSVYVDEVYDGSGKISGYEIVENAKRE